MEGLTGPLALEFLSRERAALNAIVARARLASPSFRAEDFSRGFALVAAAPLSALERAGGGARDRAVLRAIFESCAGLAANGAFRGSGDGEAEAESYATGSGELLASRIESLVASPTAVTGMLMNAFFRLRTENRDGATRWKTAMERIEGAPGEETLARCGFVAAWTAGFTAYRGAALESIAAMEGAMAARVLGLPESILSGRDMAAFARELGERPWSFPEALARGSGEERIVMERVGGFAGLGGRFLGPPTVSRIGAEFIVTDGRASFALRPDRYGSILERRSSPSPEDARASAGRTVEGPWLMDRDGNGPTKIRTKGLSFDLRAAFPRGVSSAASDGDTLCLTSPYSYAVFVAGRALA